MSKTARRGRRTFTDEFKSEAVGLVQSIGKPVGRMAKDLDLTETALPEQLRRLLTWDQGAEAIMGHIAIHHYRLSLCAAGRFMRVSRKSISRAVLRFADVAKRTDVDPSEFLNP